MKYLSVFSGMEAASVAWEPLGFTPVGFSEIEPFPSAILAHRFPNTPNYGDITQYKQWPIEPGSIDLLVGGSPCQSFSVAGLRKGLDDPRGHLMLTFLGLADKLRPRWIVWENVPGVLSSNGGRDFGAFLGALGQLGFGWAYRVLDAQHFGVPQRRKRVFVVATSSGNGRLAGEVLSLPEGLRGYLEARQQKGKAVAGATEGVLGENSKWPKRIACNLNSSFGDKLGLDNEHTLNAGAPLFVPAAIAFKVRGGSPVETGEQGGTPGKAAGKGYLGSDKTAFTVATVQDQWLAQACYPINTLALGGRPDPVNDLRMTMGIGGNGDPQFTLQAAHSHAVAVRTAQTSANGIGVANDVSHTLDRAQGQAVQPSPGMAVRRLTPVECERLQGFPDNWSRIPWKGKPEEDCPDGPRYKACGNSMAVPVMRWIGKRIQEVEGGLK